MTIQEIVHEASFGEVALSADECLKCNVCNTVCPVARVTDLFPGPKYVGPQAQRFRVATLLPPQGPSTPVLALTRCDRRLLLRLRDVHDRLPGRREDRRDEQPGAGRDEGRPSAPVPRLAARPDRSRRPARASRSRRSPTGRCATGSSGPLIEWTIGIHRRAPLPVFAGRTLRSRLAASAARPAARSRRRIGPSSCFHGCAANYYEPHVAFAAIDVLRRNGFETIAPEQVCCGLPFISNGLYSRARGKARRNLGVFADYARRGYRIVGTSTSCTHTLKAEYREMLDVDDDDAHAVAGATWDICEFLLDLHEQGRLDTGFGRLDETLPYHAPCQLRSHGIGLPALDLFALVPGLSADRHGPRLLRGRRDVRAEEGEVRHRDGRRRPALPARPCHRLGPGGLRLGDVPLADRA